MFSNEQDKILSLADNFRDYTMVDLGVRLEDRVDGSTWKLDEPTVLRGERDEKLKKAAEEKRLKLERSRDRQVFSKFINSSSSLKLVVLLDY